MIKFDYKFDEEAISKLWKWGSGFITVGLAWFFRNHLKEKLLSVSMSEIIIFMTVLVVAFCFDAIVSFGKRVYFSILLAYFATIIATGAALIFSSEKFIESGLLGLYGISAFAALRLSAQIFATKTWHWGDTKSPFDLAVTSVLIDQEKEHFLLVRNEKLNNGNGLWVSPGGRWNSLDDTPTERLLKKIASEVNLNAEVVPFDTLNQFNPGTGTTNNNSCQWFRAPHILLLETLDVDGDGFPDKHLDFIYVCAATGPAGKTPKYGLSHSISIPISSCEANFDTARKALVDAVTSWEQRQTGIKKANRADIADDVIWRLHLVSKALNEGNYFD